MKKKLFALTVTLALILFCSFSASATVTYTNGTWSIHHSSSNIYGEVVQDNCASVLQTLSSRSGVTSTCTSYYSHTSDSGETAYASVKITSVDSNGNKTTILNSGTHRLSNTQLSGNKTIVGGSTVTAKYTAKGATSVYYGISGTVEFK